MRPLMRDQHPFSVRIGNEPIHLDEGSVVAEIERELCRRTARQFVDAQERPAPAPPEIVTLRELLARRETETPWRVEGWLPAGGRVVLAAQMKAGKTTAIGCLVRCLLDGDLWLGRASVKPVSNSVAIVDTEMGLRQLQSWLRDQRIENDDRLFIAPLRGNVGAFNILEPHSRSQWAAWFRERNVDVLILDCLRPVLDGLGLDEHKDVGKFLVAFDQLLREAGISEAVIVHHMGHGEERSRGDSRLRDWPDVEWRLVRQSSDPSSPRYISAYGRDVDIRETQIQFNQQARTLTMTDGSRRDAAERSAQQAVLAALREEGEPLSYRRIEAVCRGKGHTVHAIRAAINTGIAKKIILVSNGPKNAKLHFLPESAPSASECVENELTHSAIESVSVRHRPLGRRTTRTRKTKKKSRSGDS